MEKTISCNITTYSASYIIGNCAVIPEELDSSERLWQYTFTVTEKHLKDSRLTLKTATGQSNALIDQIDLVLKAKAKDNADGSRDDSHADLSKYIVFLDFNNCKLEPEPQFKALSREKLIAQENFRLYYLFMNGFTVEYGENSHHNYIPFDRSASNARKQVISFIDQELIADPDPKKNLEKRVMLDMDFQKSGIQVIPSKYYAYRALYLSSGRSVKENNSKFVLNENTMIVLKDEEGIDLYGPKTKSGHSENWYITAERSSSLSDNNGTDFDWIKKEGAESIKSITLFDGEGMICPDAAHYISDYLHSGQKSPAASSFQIRMPFTKGMLHSVDFKKFIQEYSDITDDQFSSLLVEDFFGIYRPLKDIKIILTQSMFKAAQWLKKHCERLTEMGLDAASDPMHFYFTQFHEFEHSFRVLNTDLNLLKDIYGSDHTIATDDSDLDSGSFMKALNYQFLSTLNLGREDTIQLIKGHINALKDQIDRTISSENNNSDSPESALLDPGIQPFMAAVKCNPSFLTSEKVKSSLRAQLNNGILQALKGNLYTNCLNLFLSHDLLEFLRKLTEHVVIQNQESLKPIEIRPELQDQLLPRDCFFAPNAVLQKNLQKDNYYGVLRNPHLSRNEQCALKPLLLNEKTHPVYKNYFSHLQGLLMVSVLSPAPLTLGGADFDGDIIKLILDPIINRAICESCYTEDKDQSNPDSMNPGLIRTLPVIKIPDAGKGSLITPNPPGTIYDTAVSSFSNNIGLLSNAAVYVSFREYYEYLNPYQKTTVEMDPNISCEMCTILTGLEIDAAKTGVHPNIEPIKVFYKKSSVTTSQNDVTDFLKAKEEIQRPAENQLKPLDFSYKTSKSNKLNTIKVYPSGSSKYQKPVFVFPYVNAETALQEGRNEPPLVTLQGDIIDEITDTKKKDNLLKNWLSEKWKGKKGSSRKRKEKQFWRSTVDKKDVPYEIGVLVRAYKRIRQLFREVKNQQSKQNKIDGYIYTILERQYGTLDYMIAGETVYQISHNVIEQLSSFIRETCKKECEHTSKFEYIEFKVLVESLFTATQSWKKTVEIPLSAARSREILCPWMFTAQSDRESYLSNLGIHLGENECKLITNFNHGGYKLFYYFLESSLYPLQSLKGKEDIALYVKYQNNIYMQSENDACRKKYEEYFNDYYPAFMDAVIYKKNDSDLKKDMIRICRKRISQILEQHNIVIDSFDQVIPYVWKNNDENETLFWDLFTREELAKQIFCPGKEET